MHTAVFPGSFSPPTLGHLDLITRAASVCDRLYVAVGKNSEKGDVNFSLDERLDMLQTITKGLGYVEIVTFSGLIVDFCRQRDADFILRGIRAFSDLEYEYRMACANRRLSGIETVFLMADERHAHISSTLIREIGHCGGSLAEFVPEPLEEKIRERLQV